jgi:hypothetical protein
MSCQLDHGADGPTLCGPIREAGRSPGRKIAGQGAYQGGGPYLGNLQRYSSRPMSADAHITRSPVLTQLHEGVTMAFACLGEALALQATPLHLALTTCRNAL